MTKYILFLYLMAFHGFVFSQDKVVPIEEAPSAAEEKFEQIKIDRLKRIRKELVELQSEINTTKKTINSEVDLVTKLKLESKVEKLQEEFTKKKFLFIETATNVNLYEGEKTPESEKDISTDLKEILNPVIEGIKKISERPRLVQDLKDNIDRYEEKIHGAEQALKRLTKLKLDKDNQDLKRTINTSISAIKTVIEELKIKLEDDQFKLLKLESGNGSIVGNFSSAIFDFFKTKGKNLVLSVLIFICFFWLLRLGKNKFITLFINRVGKAVDQGDSMHWMVRPLKVFYGIFTLCTALFMSILTLYVLNDWVLVTFIIFLLAAIIWNSKNFLPQYLEQFKIILNFGAIRERERIVFQGLPWEIKSLGYYCRLVNPALSGGHLRISTKELLSHYSRPINEGEPWFPTKKDDWVELSDGTFGKIILQSPEHVGIKLIGDAIKYIPTASFLGLNPVNLSNGFSVEFAFGVDYQHQPLLLQSVIPNFKKDIQEKLYAEFNPDIESFKELIIEFQDAGASSLNIRFFLRCEGKMASRKYVLCRKVQGYFVEVCNQYNYVIPFNQLTVHMPGTIQNEQ